MEHTYILFTQTTFTHTHALNLDWCTLRLLSGTGRFKLVAILCIIGIMGYISTCSLIWERDWFDHKTSCKLFFLLLLSITLLSQLRSTLSQSLTSCIGESQRLKQRLLDAGVLSKCAVILRIAHLSPLHDLRCTRGTLQGASSETFQEDSIASLAPKHASPP